MKITAAIILSLIICFPAHAEAPEGISARSAVLMDAASGRLLYEKNGFERLPMASTTKIMTALLTAENCAMDEVVTVSPAASGVEGSSLWLEIGEKLTVRELLLGLMLKSGNDAAVALAEQTAGSVDAFVLLMNAKAKEIGMSNTGFVTPNGLDADGHYTTAYDMALLACRAMQNPDFRETVSTETASIPWQGHDWGRSLKNHNKLLGMYEGCTGIKTGFTKKAGRCLVSSAERDGRELVCVTLNAPDDWNDHIRLLDYGFGDFVAARPAERGKKWGSTVIEGKEIGLNFAEDFTVSLKPDEKTEIKFEPCEARLPVQKGQKLGRAYIFSAGDFLGGVDLVADRSVERDGLVDCMIKIAKGLI